MITLKNFQPRAYQESIQQTAKKYNTLIILPTGLGKTKTALLISIERLNLYPQSKTLFLTPTKPLAEQIQQEFQESSSLLKEEVVLFTGSVSPETREKLWAKAKVIVSTPQTISNDIINKRINVEEVSCLVVDEAHRGTGNYDYVWLAKHYYQTATYPRIIGLTASPGSDQVTIKAICQSLFIEEIEVRSKTDSDVSPYVQETEVELVKVELPEKLLKIKKFLDSCIKDKLEQLKSWGLIGSLQEAVSKKQLLLLQKSIQFKLSHGEKDIRLWQGISITAETIKAQHALELLETQGPESLYKYTSRIYEEAEKTKTKAVKNLAKDLNFKSAHILAESSIKEKIEHPKLIKLKEIIQEEVKKNKEVKIIIFNQYRDSAALIEKQLNVIPDVRAKLFVGQTKKEGIGLSQKEQAEILKLFGEYHYNVLVATSIGEEGLDIAEVNIVIFFEPVPSAIRTIQRKGRVGRQTKGRVIILMTQKTRDEAYHWVAFNKEKKMHQTLKTLKEKIKLESYTPTLDRFLKEPKVTIYIDSREKDSGIAKELIDQNVNIETKNLITDFVISDEIGIERKTVQDFADSIVDGRLLDQLKELKQNFPRPLIILEGDEDIYSVRKIHAHAIQGMLATITLSYGIPIISTKNTKETVSLLKVIANRFQTTKPREFTLRTGVKPLTLKEQQEFIIESLPGIGPSLAKSLLESLKSVSNIINSPEEVLQQVEKVGPKKAKEIRRVIDEEYKNG